MAATAHSYISGEEMPLGRERRRVWRAPSRIEQMWTAVILFYLSGAIVPLLAGSTEETDTTAIKPASLAIKAGIYAVLFFYVGRNWRQVLPPVRKLGWVLAPVLMAFISVAWSQHPSLTLRGSAVLSATSAVGIYLGARYTIAGQLRLLAYVLITTMIASYAFAMFLPAYGLEQQAYVGAWRGAFIQKNNMAQVMVLSCFVLHAVRPWMSRWICWGGIAASLGLVVLSRSVTAILVAIVVVALIPAYKLVRAPFTLVIASTLLTSLFLGLAFLFAGNNLRSVLQIVNRSPDLTGRTELWNAVLSSWAKRPILGYGFSAFWVGMQGESGNVWRAVGWKPGYSHNGFLDILIQLGIVGLAIFLVGYVILWGRGLQQFRHQGDPKILWLCTYLAFMAIYNLTEGSILEQNNLLWAIYVCNAVSLNRPWRSDHPVAWRQRP